jgi:hypothetical protein
LQQQESPQERRSIREEWVIGAKNEKAIFFKIT